MQEEKNENNRNFIMYADTRIHRYPLDYPGIPEVMSLNQKVQEFEPHEYQNTLHIQG